MNKKLTRNELIELDRLKHKAHQDKVSDIFKKGQQAFAKKYGVELQSEEEKNPNKFKAGAVVDAITNRLKPKEEVKAISPWEQMEQYRKDKMKKGY